MTNRKYREYTYSYSRWNPQTGTHEHTSTVIAFSEANARKLAKRACDSAIYGYNEFKEIVAKGPVLTEGIDYRLYEKGFERRLSHSTRMEYETVAEKIYHDLPLIFWKN